MIRHWRPGIMTRLVVLFAVIAMVASACSSDDDDADDSGISQADLDAVTAELSDANDQISALEGQLSSAQVTTQVIQVGELAPSQYDTVVPGDGWATEESVRGGLWLEAQFDSSGPDAWDIEAHPRVYFTSESYQSNYYNDNDLPEVGQFAGWHVIDAYSKEVVASALYEYGGEVTRGPHGVGVSPDGKWGYVGWMAAEEGESGVGYVGIINIRTMKLDKVLSQSSSFEGGTRSQAIHHIQCWTNDENGEDYSILQWGFGANGGPHFIIKPNDDNRVFRAINYDDVNPMGHPFTTPDPTGQYVYISMGGNFIRHSDVPAAGIAKLDILTGEHEEFHEVGRHPIGITHTQDGRFTYVIDGTSSQIYKLDNESGHVVDRVAAGIAGPYGICLEWDETVAWIVGKGEGTANLGNSLAAFDLGPDVGGGRFRASRAHGNTPFYLGGSAASVDHCALHPDSSVNEIWVSNMKGWETIVVNLDTLTVTDYINTPNNGDTHGMAFVWYDGGWDDGMLMGDMGGPKAQVFQDEVRANADAAQAG